MNRLTLKRWASIMTIIAIVCTTLTGRMSVVEVSAEEAVSTNGLLFSEGSGTQEDPWLISTADQLNEIRHYEDKNFKLVNDIDLSNYGDGSWIPIDSFSGTLEGDNYIIKGLYVRGYEGGLFNTINESASVKRVNLDVDIDGTRNSGGFTNQLLGEIIESSVTGSVKGFVLTGGIAAEMKGNSSIVDSYANAYVEGKNGTASATGGLVGMSSINVEVNGSHSSGTVTGIGRVGGLVGYGGGQISNSFSNAYIRAYDYGGTSQAGGLVGFTSTYYETNIRGSYFSGTIQSDGIAGGLIGENSLTASQCSIDNSYSKGVIKGYQNVGGLIGEVAGKCTVNESFSGGIIRGEMDFTGGLIGVSSAARITNSYSIAKLSGQGFVGGLIGMNFAGKSGFIKNSFSVAEINGIWHLDSILAFNNDGGSGIVNLAIDNTYWNTDRTNTSSQYGGIGVTTEGMKQQGTYDNWDFDTVWGIEENTTYPYLRSISMNAQDWEEPFLIRAKISLEDRDHLVLTFNKAVEISNLDGINISRNGEALQVKKATNINGEEWIIELESPVLYYDTLTFSYHSNAGSIMDLNNNPLSGVNDWAVINEAASYAGSGTKEDPWTIATPSQLDGIRYLDKSDQKYYTLVADIDLTSYVRAGGKGYNNGEGWQPIQYFNGYFDGAGHTIKGLYIRGEHGGLFEYLGKESLIHNLSLIETDIEAASSAGAIASTLKGRIENSFATGNIKGGTGVGGLAGKLETAVIVNSYSKANISGMDYVGGLAGSAIGSSVIATSFSDGSVSGLEIIGGLLGRGEQVEVTNSYSVATVAGEEQTGGLVGLLEDGAAVHNSFSVGNMGNSLTAGGLIGSNVDPQSKLVVNSFWDMIRTKALISAGGVGYETTKMKQQDTYATWDFDHIWAIEQGATYPYLRGIERGVQPDVAAPTVVESYIGPADRGKLTIIVDEPIRPVSWMEDFLIETGQGTKIGPKLIRNVDSKTVEFELSSSVDLNVPIKFSHMDTSYFQDYSGNSINNYNGSAIENRLSPDPYFAGGSGTQDHPLKIATPEHLDNIRVFGDTTDQYFELSANIDLNNYLGEAGAGYDPNGWEPIPLFNGTLDGAGYTIKGLSMSHRSGGLFGQLNTEAVVKNLTLQDVSFNEVFSSGAIAGSVYGVIADSSVSGILTNSENSGHSIGGIAGILTGNGEIKNSHTNVHITGNSRLGGLAGTMQNGQILNSYTEGSVTGISDLGGLVGDFDGVIKDSHSAAAIKGNDNVGGLAGQFVQGTIARSFSSGDVVGASNVGGLVGYGADTMLRMTDSYSIADVKGNDHVGGLAGYYNGSIVNSYSLATISGSDYKGIFIGRKDFQETQSIVESYWDRDRTAIGSIYGGEGLGTAELKQQSTFRNWDFDSVWKITNGSQYPHLLHIDTALQKDEAPPVVVAAEIGIEARDQLIVTFDEPAYQVDVNGFSMKVNGSPIGITAVVNHNGNRMEWVLQLDQALNVSETTPDEITLSYQLSASPITDSVGNRMTSFSDKGVTVLWPEPEFAGGSGSLEDPWQLVTPRHLSNIRNYQDQKDVHFKLAADIDLFDYIASGDAGVDGWQPINSFSGSLDGAGFEIKGLSGKSGLFHTVMEEAIIRNLGLVDVDIDTNRSVGAITATLYGTIQDSYVSGSITVSSNFNSLGGLAGDIKGKGRILDSHNDALVKGGSYTGGLAGNIEDDGVITSSFNTGVIEGDSFVGGLVGNITGSPRVAITDSYNTVTGAISGTRLIGGLTGALYYASIENSYNHGSVTGNNSVGGLVGYSMESCNVRGSYNNGEIVGQLSTIGGLIGTSYDCILENSYNNGNIKGDNQVGGLVGMAGGVKGTHLINCYNTAAVTGRDSVGGLAGSMFGGSISNSFASSEVIGTGAYIGGLIGEGRVANQPVVENSYWNTDHFGSNEYGGIGKSTIELKQKATYSGWDFSNVWNIEDGSAFPYLQGKYMTEPSDTVEPFVIKAEIKDEKPDQLLIIFDEEVQMTASGFILAVNGQSQSLQELEITSSDTKEWLITFNAPVPMDAYITLTYDAVLGTVTDRAGNRLSSFSDRPVTMFMISNDATVTAGSDAYAVIEDDKTIISNQTDSTVETTVLKLLSELTKHEKTVWKVVDVGANITSIEQFEAATEKQETDLLAVGDQLAIMAEDGTIAVYRIIVKSMFNVFFEANGGTSINSQVIVSGKYADAPSNPIRAGYRFDGWFLDNGVFEQPMDLVSTPITSDTIVYAKWTTEQELVVAVTSVHSIVTGVETSYQYGESVLLTAMPEEGYQFESWKDAVTGKVLSIQLNYSFNITEGVSLVAISSKIEEETFTVRFVNESGYVLSIQQVSRGGDATAPPSPSKPDAEFLGWSLDYTNIEQDITLKPIYSEKVKRYTLTVHGGSTPSGETSYLFDSKVTVKADDPGEGSQFSHWENNDKIVSYNEGYTFYITGNTTLTAMYKSVPVVRSPIVTISPDVITNPSAMKMSFIGQIDLSSPFVFVETGVVVKKSATPITELHFGTANAIKARSSAQTKTGQFMMNKTGVQSGETWYAVTYLIYKEESGEVITIYSDVVSGTMP